MSFEALHYLTEIREKLEAQREGGITQLGFEKGNIAPVLGGSLMTNANNMGINALINAFTFAEEVWDYYAMYNDMYGATPFQMFIETARSSVGLVGCMLKMQTRNSNRRAEYVMCLNITYDELKTVLRDRFRFRYGLTATADHIHVPDNNNSIVYGRRFYLVTGNNNHALLKHLYFDVDNPKNQFEAHQARECRTAPATIYAVPTIPLHTI